MPMPGKGASTQLIATDPAEWLVVRCCVGVLTIVDEKMFHALHSPHTSLEPKHQDLIWKLLVNVSPKDVLFLYWYDKEEFYKQFKTWNESMKDWVIETIRNNI